MTPRRSWPLVGLGVAVLAVSTSAILIRFSDAPPVVAAFYRVTFTVALVLPVAIGRYRTQLGTMDRRDLGVASVAGVALAVHFAAWFESLSWTSVAASVTLVQVQPIVVAIGASLLLAERVSPRTAIGIGVALAGATLLTAGDLLAGAATVGRWPALGNGLALVGALAGGGYVLAGRSLRQHLPVIPYVTVVFASCAAVLGVALALSSVPLLGYPPREWLLFAAMAVGPGILGHTLVNWVLGHLRATLVSVALVAEPVGSAALAAVVLGEVPTVATLAGGGVVLAGITVTVLERADGESH